MFAIPEHAAVTVALGFPLTGCLGWTQPGYDAGQSRWNSGADQITPANVDDLVQLWDVTHPGSPWLNSPLSDGGTIYLTTTGGDTPGRATALDAVMGGYAHGFSSACPPNPPPVGGCAPDWSIPFGTASVRDVAALDTDSAIVLDTDNRLTVLDVNDGTVEWSAELGPTETSGIVVAGDSILVKGFVDTAGPTSALLALPRSGCGASTCTPSWTAHLFEGFYSSQIYAESVAAGQVVYAATDKLRRDVPGRWLRSDDLLAAVDHQRRAPGPEHDRRRWSPGRDDERRSRGGLRLADLDLVGFPTEEPTAVGDPNMAPDQAELAKRFVDVVGAANVLTGEEIKDDYSHDEALTTAPQVPAAVVLPSSTDEVAAILRVADEHGIPVTARGAGTGMSGACTPLEDGIVVSFERMNRILEIDEDNFVAVVEPGVQLDQLDAELAPRGLIYPVFPGEYSASLGGNVNTNAGGMRAVKYGVTRHQVLGLEAVLASGEVVTSGGKVVKISTGYDLTQLIVGSEGTLALVTKAYLKLYPRPDHGTTVLAPFPTLDAVTSAVPKVVASGVGPLILEYIDMLTMAAATAHVGLDLGIPEDVRESALAYLVVALEDTHTDRLDEDTQTVSELLAELGAIDVYVLPPGAAAQLIDAREKAFWVAKASGADDIIDVVIPRATIPEFMAQVSEIATTNGAWIAGCGHAGDGNVHMAVFQKDSEIRSRILTELFRAGMALGGAISGEHGLGRAKKAYFMALEDPAKIELMRRIKAAFDPNGILNPGAIFD